jgi:hypothetical protein
MSKVEAFENELQRIDKEICRMEQLNMTSDKMYYLLQMQRATLICEIEYCKENNL